MCGALGIYSICRANDYEFDIYLPADHPLSSCFQVATKKPHIAKQIIMNAELFNGAAVKRRLTKEMHGLPLKVIMVSTNVQDIATDDEMDYIVEDFMKLLRPSANLMTAVEKLRNELGLGGPYASIHVRCGDAHMTGTTINMRDNRITPATALPLVQRAADIIGKTMPVIVHTDSLTLRNSIQCSASVKVCNTVIQHTGEPTLSGADFPFLETVAEFYVMCGACEIYYAVPSGFSRFSALFQGVYPIKIDDAFINAKDQTTNSFTPLMETAPSILQKKNIRK